MRKEVEQGDSCARMTLNLLRNGSTVGDVLLRNEMVHEGARTAASPILPTDDYVDLESLIQKESMSLLGKVKSILLQPPPRGKSPDDS